MFITFEGPEGSGKTTQVALLAETLRSLGRRVVCTREPGGVAVAEKLRELVLHGELFPETEALLFLAARAEHARAVIHPALEGGAVVLCDRFNDSTLAYQGYGLGLDVERLRLLCDFAAGGMHPALTLLLDVPPETGLRRRLGDSKNLGVQMALEMELPGHVGGPVHAAQEVNKIENRRLEFHHRVRAGFLAEAERDPQRVRVINAARPVETVRRAISQEVLSALGLEPTRTGRRAAEPG
jgi:dTMP kinase